MSDITALTEQIRRQGLYKQAEGGGKLQLMRTLGKLSKWYSGLSGEQRDALFGAGGAVAGGLLGAMNKRPGQGALGPALLGALLGGTAGYGGSAGIRSLNESGVLGRGGDKKDSKGYGGALAGGAGGLYYGVGKGYARGKPAPLSTGTRKAFTDMPSKFKELRKVKPPSSGFSASPRPPRPGRTKAFLKSLKTSPRAVGGVIIPALIGAGAGHWGQRKLQELF